MKAPRIFQAIRDAANGEECTLRTPRCNFRTDTTVLAHVRHLGDCGTAIKPPDYQGVFACSGCHALLDGPASAFADRDFYVARALVRTMARLIERGVMTVKGVKR